MENVVANKPYLFREILRNNLKFVSIPIQVSELITRRSHFVTEIYTGREMEIYPPPTKKKEKQTLSDRCWFYM